MSAGGDELGSNMSGSYILGARCVARVRATRRPRLAEDRRASTGAPRRTRSGTSAVRPRSYRDVFAIAIHGDLDVSLHRRCRPRRSWRRSRTLSCRCDRRLRQATPPLVVRGMLDGGDIEEASSCGRARCSARVPPARRPASSNLRGHAAAATHHVTISPRRRAQASACRQRCRCPFGEEHQRRRRTRATVEIVAQRLRAASAEQRNGGHDAVEARTPVTVAPLLRPQGSSAATRLGLDAGGALLARIGDDRPRTFLKSRSQRAAVLGDDHALDLRAAEIGLPARVDENWPCGSCPVRDADLETGDSRSGIRSRSARREVGGCSLAILAPPRRPPDVGEAARRPGTAQYFAGDRRRASHVDRAACSPDGSFGRLAAAARGTAWRRSR